MTPPGISASIAPFASLLSGIDPQEVSSNVYTVAYLRHLLEHKVYYLNIFADLLARLPDRQQIRMIDYGAGNGLFGIFAKYCGCGYVVINDIHPDFLSCARVLATKLGVSVDLFLQGDLPELTSRLQGDRINTLVGTNVVEHIYDLSSFMDAARDIDIRTMLLMTGAQPMNPIKTREIKHIQRIDEFEGTPADAAGGQPAVPSFESQRYHMILKAHPKLDLAEAGTLARLTRGLRKDDILAVTNHYVITGEWPVELTHPSNTCDPQTGSWTERLLSFEEYRQLFARAGFALSIASGFYNSFEPTLKSVLLKMLNLIIRRNERLGYRISPYIVLEGRRL